MKDQGTVLVGIGNDVLSDDRIGPYLARRLGKKLNVSFCILPHISLDLLDYVENKDTVIIIDSFHRPDYPVGEIKQFQLSDLESRDNPTYSHGVTIPIIFEMGKKIGSPLPEKTVVFGINVSDNLTLSEDFSEKIQGKIDEIARNLEIHMKNFADSKVVTQK
ncbi:MAG: hydrogenase maturation protease [Candidatus Aminicenantes bacterium]|nr:hydrogenase maturation protease [Candidatus Aminicenantes bacterium]